MTIYIDESNTRHDLHSPIDPGTLTGGVVNEWTTLRRYPAQTWLPPMVRLSHCNLGRAVTKPDSVHGISCLRVL